MFGFLVGVTLGVIITLALVKVIIDLLNGFGGGDEDEDDGFMPEPPDTPKRPPGGSGPDPSDKPYISKELTDAIAERFGIQQEDEEDDEEAAPLQPH